jgi:hypothetical protein
VGEQLGERRELEPWRSCVADQFEELGAVACERELDPSAAADCDACAERI